MSEDRGAGPARFDFGWVLETTFVLAVVIGAPVIGLSAYALKLPTWSARLRFALPLAAAVWLVIGASVYLYARHYGETGD